MSYFMSLNPLSLFRAMPGSIAQGMIWGVMALGVYITFRLLDFADLTVDGSIATGAAVSVMLIRAGVSPIATLPIAFLAGALAGMVTGLLNTALGIPGILASILTQISLYSINLNIMGKANQPVSAGGIFALCDGWFGEQTSLFPGNDRIFTGTDRCDVLVFWNRTGTCYPCYGL